MEGRAFTIAHISDIHCGGPDFVPNLMERAVERDQRARAGHRHLLGRPDDVRLQAGVRAGEGLPRPDRVRVVRGDPRQPRFAQRRLRPLRGDVRRPQLGAQARRRHRRRRRLDRARPRPRPDRARALPLDRGAVLPVRPGRDPDLRPAPPPAAGSGHGPRAQRRLRRGRLHRVPAARGGRSRPFRAQARSLCMAAREPVRRQRRHRLVTAAPRQDAALLQRDRDRRPARGRLAQVPVPRRRSGSSSSRRRRWPSRSTRRGSRTR